MTHVLAAVAPLTARRVEVQAIKTAIVMAVLIVGFRLFGKREAAQLNVYDLAMVMALANAVQNAMTGGLGNLPVGLATSSTVVVVAWLVTRFLRRRPSLEERVIGTPTLLVNRGQVIGDALRRQRVTQDELDEACRQHGVDGTGEVSMAVLEVDGSISVIGEPAPVKAPRRRRRRAR
jgi:uncharacterized membrane protein YcaP (DUF421 family)